MLNWEYVTRSFAVIGIALSAISAYQSRVAAEASRDQSATSTLLQSRLQALRQYNEAYGELDAAMQSAIASTAEAGVDLEEPQQLAQLSMEDARKVVPATRSIIVTFRQYQAHVNSARAIWPDYLEAQIVDAGDHAAEAAACYQSAGSPPMNPAELIAKRTDLGTKCAKLDAKYTQFRTASNDVVNAMVRETRANLGRIGADWLKPAPEPTPSAKPSTGSVSRQ